MKIGDWFGKLDDIVYEPIKLISDWARQPISALETNREIKIKEKEMELICDKERKLALINAEQRRWHVEIDNMISDQEDSRRDKLVESLKRYQIDLAEASTEIVVQIGNMTLELRERANQMMLERTKDYEQMQHEAFDKAMSKLDEINSKFANNDRVRLLMEDTVIDQMRSIIDAATKFISELNEDIKKINSNIDELTKLGMQNTNKLLQPIANKLGYNETIHENILTIESKNEA